MAATGWFETVAEAQRRAQKRLPASVYSALVAGSEKSVTVGDNLSAFNELGFAPHVAGLSGKRDQATTVMGQDMYWTGSRDKLVGWMERAHKSVGSGPSRS